MRPASSAGRLIEQTIDLIQNREGKLASLGTSGGKQVLDRQADFEPDMTPLTHFT